MRRPFFLAALVILAISLPLQAQRSGGHGGGGGGHATSGGHGGFSGGSGFGGHSGGSRSFSGGRSGAAVGARSFRGSALRGSARSGRGLNRGFNRNGNFRLRTYGYGNNCFGYACRSYGYPWGYGGFYDPYWWSDSGSSYDQDQEDENGLANEMNQQSLEEQSQRQQGDQNSYGQAPRQHQPERTVAAPATVLVFRDQHKQEVQNYAIVGETLWNFAPQHTQKIPLDDLDIPATTKTNEDRGVNFWVPVTMGKLTLQIQSVD
jgi:hypothetical protein